tara:strand:+ start:4578 stop:5165 length:588 start_codon:yes stop_codon:yes gene_type:complete
VIISPKYRRRLVIMVKEPRAGRVKTRLGNSIGMTAAAWWFRHQSQQLIRRLVDPRWELILAISPDHEVVQSRFWSPSVARIPQGKGNLGDRMRAIFKFLPPGPVCIIGADIPKVNIQKIWAAFRILGNHQVTLGPAQDGGYWLIGLKRDKPLSRQMFKSVRWSSNKALSDTIASLSNLSIGYLDTLNDVDDVSDL